MSGGQTSHQQRCERAEVTSVNQAMPPPEAGMPVEASRLDRAILRTSAAISAFFFRYRRVVPFVLAAVLIIALYRLVHATNLSKVVLLTLAFAIGLIQASFLARTRTISFSSLRTLAALAGAVVPWIVVATIRPIRTSLGLQSEHWLAMGVLTPLCEEAFKLLPLILILGFSSRARSMSMADVTLLAFASGLSFGFFEEMVRPDLSSGIDIIRLTQYPNAKLWTDWSWSLLATVPADPGNWWGYGHSHALFSGTIGASIAFLHRAIRLKQPILRWVLLVALVFAFVAISHAELNSAGMSPFWRSAVGFVGAASIFRWLLAALVVAVIAVDLRDVQHLRPARRWLVPVLPRGGLKTYMADLVQDRADRCDAFAKLYGAPPGPASIWTVRTRDRLQRTRSMAAAACIAGAGIYIALVAYSLTGLPHPDGFGLVCVECFIMEVTGWDADTVLMLEVLAGLVPFLGEAIAVVELREQRDYFTGDELPWWRSVLNVISLIPLLGTFADIGNGFVRTLARSARIGGEFAVDGAGGVARTVVRGAEATSGAGASWGRMGSIGSRLADRGGFDSSPMASSGSGSSGSSRSSRGGRVSPAPPTRNQGDPPSWVNRPGSPQGVRNTEAWERSDAWAAHNRGREVITLQPPVKGQPDVLTPRERDIFEEVRRREGLSPNRTPERIELNEAGVWESWDSKHIGGPHTANPTSAMNGVWNAIDPNLGVQARRVSINIDGSPTTMEELAREMREINQAPEWHIERYIDEVIINRDGEVLRVFPE